MPDSPPSPSSPPPAADSPTPVPTPAPLPVNEPPPPAGRAWLNTLIAVSFMAFAFSAYWLYMGYRDKTRDEAEQRRKEDEKRNEEQALFGNSGLSPTQVQTAADSAVKFLLQRPEFSTEIGPLINPKEPLAYRVSLTDELHHPDDLKFRMTVRGVTSHAWYDTILRRAGDSWELQQASLTVPDMKALDGRKVIHLLDPAPQAAP